MPKKMITMSADEVEAVLIEFATKATGFKVNTVRLKIATEPQGNLRVSAEFTEEPLPSFNIVG